jgi:hypothetical protein
MLRTLLGNDFGKTNEAVFGGDIGALRNEAFFECTEPM